jgi:hypothetical protein
MCDACIFGVGGEWDDKVDNSRKADDIYLSKRS